MRLGIALVALAACQASMAETPGGGSAELPPAERFERDLMLRFHMHENLGLVHGIERLLIRGQLEDAKRFAAAIAEAPDEPGMQRWTKAATVVRDRAAALARTTTVDDALRAEAQLAAACASCHVEAGALLELRTPPALPPDQPTLAARMARHRWAADRMWEGIIIGADEPWRAGLDVLAASPLDWKTIAPERAAVGRELQRLATQARQSKHATIAERATAYGEILTTCARCHTAPAPR